MKQNLGLRILSGSAIIGGFTLLAKLLGFVQRLVLANRFGAGAEVDAYTVAFASVVFTLIVIPRDLLAPFLPIFVEQKEKDGEAAAWSFAGIVGSWLAILTGAVALAGMLHAEPIARLVSNFETESTTMLAARLLRIMLPATFFMALFWMGGLMLNAYKRFGIPAFAEVLNRILTVGSIVVLHAVLGIRGLALGVALGSVSCFLLQVFGLRRSVHLLRPSLRLSHPAVKRLGTLMLPILIGTLIAQTRTILNYWFASGMGEGLPASLSFAKGLSDTIIVVLPLAIGTVIYPYFAEMTSLNKWAEAGRALTNTLRMVALFFVPLSVGLAVLSVPVVRLLFHHGEFTRIDVHNTATPLIFYAAGLTILAWEIMLMRFYFSAKDTRTPIAVGIGCMGLHVGAILLLRQAMGHNSIPLAESFQKFVKISILLGLLRWKLPTLRLSDHLPFVAKLALAATAMGLAVHQLLGWLELWFPAPEEIGLLSMERLFGLGGTLAACGALGVVVFVAGLLLLKVPEALQARTFVLGKIREKLHTGPKER